MDKFIEIENRELQSFFNGLDIDFDKINGFRTWINKYSNIFQRYIAYFDHLFDHYIGIDSSEITYSSFFDRRDERAPRLACIPVEKTTQSSLLRKFASLFSSST